ncbi:MAG: hypothetical protein ACOCTI_04230 [Phycisphaeraceae bacterium]
MPCLAALIAVFFPRIFIVLLWVLNPAWLDRAYQTLLWPLLGFIFLPFTTLAYAFAMNQAGGVRGVYLFVFALAVLMDLGSLSGSGYSSRRRYRRW